MVMNEECWYYIEADEEMPLGGCVQGKSEDWCDEHCPIFKNMKAAFTHSGLEQQYWYPFTLKSVSVDSKEVSKIMQIRNNLIEFVEEGNNILIQSSKCGNGKTSWGIKLLQKQIELSSKQSSIPAYFVYTPSLLLEARKSINSKNTNFEKLVDILENCPLVMFDDVASIPLKDYDLLILSSIIEKRLTRKLSSIFTTNCENDVLKVNLGDRLFDRINRLSTIITFKGGSMRGKDE